MSVDLNIRLFPVLDEKDLLVPYELVMKHNQQAFANHMQNVDRLAERGGLSVEELYYVLSDEPYDHHTYLIRSKAIQWIVDKIEEYNKGLLERAKEADKLGLRPCVMQVQTGYRQFESKIAYFHRWTEGTRFEFKDENYISKGREKVKCIYAVVEFEDGQIDDRVFPSNLRFTDR